MELFRLLGTISIDAEQANRAIDETTNNARDSEKKQAGAFSKIGKAAGTLAKGVAGAGAVMGGAFVAVTESTREYRTSMGMLETAYKTSGHSADDAKSTYSELNAILGDSGQATEAAQHLAMLTDNQKDLQTWTDICAGVYAKFGESIPIESLTESANEVAKSGELTGGLVDALVWAGIGEEEFQGKLDACTTEQERQKLIMDTLNGTYKEASDQYKETNKDVLEAEKAQAKLTDAFSQLGAIGEPIMTAIKTKVADMVTVAVPHIESFVGKVKDLRQWIQNNKETIDTWVAVIIGAGVSIGAFLLILNWGTIMKSATSAVKGVRIAILALNTALRANPIGLVVSLIAGLVTAFIYLWNNNEGFRKFWLDMWDKIKSTTSKAISAVKSKIDDIKAALGVVKTTFNGIKDTITEKMEAAKDKVDEIIGKIKGFFPLSIGKIFSNLKIPKISVSGGKAPYGIAGKGKLPSFDVKWNAQGAIFDKPTIFSTASGFQGVGEAGAEAVSPISTLQEYIGDAVETKNEYLIRALETQISRLISFMQDYLPSDYKIMLDTGILAGELTPEINSRLADTYKHNKRGNTR